MLMSCNVFSHCVACRRLAARMLAVVLLMAVMPARVEAQGFSLEHDFAVLDTVVRNVDKYM